MIIRDVKPDDKAKIINMMKEFYDMPAVLHTIPESNFKNTFEEIIKDTPYARLLVLESQEKLIGYCLLSFGLSNEAGGLCVFIEEIMIDKALRNKGYGEMIFKYIFDEYKGKAKRFRLEATKENEKAIKLYKRLGFENLDYLQMVIDEK